MRGRIPYVDLDGTAEARFCILMPSACKLNEPQMAPAGAKSRLQLDGAPVKSLRRVEISLIPPCASQVVQRLGTGRVELERVPEGRLAVRNTTRHAEKNTVKVVCHVRRGVPHDGPAANRKRLIKASRLMQSNCLFENAPFVRLGSRAHAGSIPTKRLPCGSNQAEQVNDPVPAALGWADSRQGA